MKKSERKLLAETLDKALEPPPKRKPALASHLADYDEGPTPAVAVPRKVTPPDPTSRGVTPPNPTRPLTAQPAAPQRDFNKRANSLDRVALPAGIFPGSSKKLYDALYIRTRGAVVPAKSIRATKRELSDWSGIRNAKTIDAHLRYFSAVGLIISSWERGQNDGSLYEVLLPEETSGLFVRSRGVTPPDPTLQGDTPPDGELLQNSGSPHHQNLGSPHVTNLPVESIASDGAKTSFKTNTESDDDEAYADFLAALKKATKEITGREASPTERQRWAELADLLVTELKIAAGRTTVSNVPAFFTEHLRRRLWKKEKRQIEAEAAEQKKSALVPEVDASKCPDCFGTGMYYPGGFEKGVARCPHSKLTPEAAG
ncbi:MAG: hypothetical protein M3441_19810 [Chloroflexota bacterium]|nr:hypothetical protein [Chloroflexota bacterium]